MVHKKPRSSYLLSKMGRSGFFPEPFDQITKVRTFLMQKWPMANNIFYWDFLLKLLLHTLPLVIVAFRKLSVARNGFIQRYGKRVFQILNMLIIGSFRFPGQKILVGQRRAHAFWAPDVRALENHVFAHFGAEKIRNSKIFFSSNQPFCRPN